MGNINYKDKREYFFLLEPVNNKEFKELIYSAHEKYVKEGKIKDLDKKDPDIAYRSIIENIILTNGVEFRKSKEEVEKTKDFYVNKIGEEKYNQYIDQAISDNTENILSFMIAFNQNAEELRKTIGSGRWRKISNNSYFENCLFIRCLEIVFKNDTEEFLKALKETDNIDSMVVRAACTCAVKQRSKLPLNNWLLKIFQSEVIENLDEIKNDRDLLSFISKTFDILRDTKSMADNLNMPFNPKWSFSTIKAAHSQYTTYMKSLEVDYPKDKVFPISELSNKLLKNISTPKGYSIKPLNTIEDFIMEGVDMSHCIQNYIPESIRGKFVGFHLQKVDKDGKVCGRTTLGLNVFDDLDYNNTNINSEKEFSLMQHYRSNNRQVTDPNFIQIQNSIIKALNKK